METQGTGRVQNGGGVLVGASEFEHAQRCLPAGSEAVHMLGMGGELIHIVCRIQNDGFPVLHDSYMGRWPQDPPVGASAITN